MGLETRRIRETKKPEEKKENIRESVKSLKELIESLPVDDIDIEWIKKNEAREFKFKDPNQNTTNTTNTNKDHRLQDVLAKAERVSSFGRPEKKESNSASRDDLDEIIKIFQDSFKDNENTVSSTQVPPTEPPTIDPILPVNEEPKAQEIEDTTALLEELNNKIDKKYNRLTTELANLYNSNIINQEADIIRGDLQSLMNIKDRSLEELTQVDKALNGLISRFAKLSQKADEIKAADDFKISQQASQMRFLEEYQKNLQNNYGKYWFGKMNEQEKEQYIQMYCATYNVSRDVVEKQIDDSIQKAYNEILQNNEQKKQQENTIQPQANDNQQPFVGESAEMIKFNGKKALETLKHVYSKLSSASPEQIEEFNYLYAHLSALSKYKPTNLKEEQEQLNQLFDVTDQINALNNRLNNTSTMSR